MSETLETYCRGQRKELLWQWHPRKNEGMAPGQISSGSRKKVWWRCEKGHEWQAVIHVRTGNHDPGCPYCSGVHNVTERTDLATFSPELAMQWHPTKNEDLQPDQVSYYAYKKVWWRCEKGHEWQASVTQRAEYGTGCPVCTGKITIAGENDLATMFPDIAAQWHPTKNGYLTVQSVPPVSRTKVWWLCDKGHEFAAQISNRTKKGTECPYCKGKKVLAGFNDVATLEPRVASEWHPTLNKDLTPAMVTIGSRKMVWWQCQEGHVWKAAVFSRASKQKTGCPVCAGIVNVERLKRYASER